jgi:hypothetical protein
MGSVMEERAKIVALTQGMTDEKQEEYLRENDRKLCAVSVLRQSLDRARTRPFGYSR